MSSVITLGTKVEGVAFGVGILATVAAAYYAGSTGEWVPLIVGSLGLGVLVVLTT